MDYQQYSPGVHKFVHHLDHIKNIISGKCVAPIHISVWPTIKCQFNCSYCCCRNVSDNEGEINIFDFKNAVDVFARYGTKAIEFSGGGEPTLWEHFNDGVQHVYEQGIKLSLITNGVTLKDIPRDILKMFSWIRVSLQSLSHAEKINFKDIPTRISCSYIVSEVADLDTIFDLYTFSVKNNIIIRVNTKKPCPMALIEIVKREIAKFKDNKTMFFSDKEFGKPLGCYMAWVRAAIDWRGNFLPCPSMQLNKDSDGKIPDNFPLCHIKDIEQWIRNNPPHDLGYRCELCNCGKEHNDLIANLISGVEDVEFV